MQTELFSNDLGSPVKTASERKVLQQYLTPEWAAERLVEHYFPELDATHCVLEPACGHGAFLKSIPAVTHAFGIELDEASAAYARENTGRPIITGDFRVVELPWKPTHVIGNPPFAKSMVDQLLAKAAVWLPQNGRMGLILPTHQFQYAKSLTAWRETWSIRQDAIPREIFPRISIPLSFVILEKNFRKTLHGFFLYDEVQEMKDLNKHVRLLLSHGQPRKSAWRALVREAVTQLGGQASLPQIYEWCGDKRPTGNQFWREKIRQSCQVELTRVGKGTYALAA